MKNSEISSRMSNFSHIYIEEEVLEHENTKKIMSHFKTSHIIKINSYKEIFNRKGQNFALQKESMKLILARKRDHYIYNGAEVCEDFGNENFYYTASIMNCVYNCEYCYLQGMYPSGYIVIFVNIEDTFADIERILSFKKNMYLCISYDTDLLAMEGITGFLSKWLDFAAMNKNLKIELRTKCSNYKVFERHVPLENFILSWTLSPEEITNKYEKGTPSLSSRIEAINRALKLGWKVRLCFDPVLNETGWQKLYSRMIQEVFEAVDGSKIEDISLGVFRISKDYMKNMLKVRPQSLLLSYPFTHAEGVLTYSDEEKREMTQFVFEKVQQFVDKQKIY